MKTLLTLGALCAGVAIVSWGLMLFGLIANRVQPDPPGAWRRWVVYYTDGHSNNLMAPSEEKAREWSDDPDRVIARAELFW